ncbi:hypothetical protein XENTR_v10013682 [Xenopus tropicalis]|nr:hypothetical protein XENTR_v10013682 [Xenopus tropicalis]KAE8601484.1 hypothetical protein XENTR_v10013682 [Xenopus tropicalis]
MSKTLKTSKISKMSKPKKIKAKTRKKDPIAIVELGNTTEEDANDNDYKIFNLCLQSLIFTFLVKMLRKLRDVFCSCLPCCRQPETTEAPEIPETPETPKALKKEKPKTCKYEDPRGILKLGEAIGEGATGLVCKGCHLKTNDTVAIKIINAEKAEDKEIKNEIEILQSYTEHKNIATFHGVYLNPVPKGREKLWIAMEYCGGGNIVELVSNTPYRSFHETWIAYIIREVLRALKYLHGQQVVHCDIKGLNIALTEDARVRLIDFGVSQKLNQGDTCKDPVGTPHWLAPEVWFAAGFETATYDYKVRCLL